MQSQFIHASRSVGKSTALHSGLIIPDSFSVEPQRAGRAEEGRIHEPSITNLFYNFTPEFTAKLAELGFAGAGATPELSFFHYGVLYSKRSAVAFLCVPRHPFKCTVAGITVQELSRDLKNYPLEYFQAIGIPKARALNHPDVLQHIMGLYAYDTGYHRGGVMPNSTWTSFGDAPQDKWAAGLERFCQLHSKSFHKSEL